jgi:hypothetical protein
MAGPYFSDDAIRKMDEHTVLLRSKYQELMLAYAQRSYPTPKAFQFAMEGYCRRVGIMARCISKVFEIIPPSLSDVPEKDTVTDCIIHLQAFLVNAFGSIDNLAWVLVHCLGIVREDGSDLPRGWVGLRKGNEYLRSRLSADLQARLVKSDDWFEYLENYRHALGHRIPPYVPPYVVDHQGVDEHNDLEQRMQAALLRVDMDEYDRLEKERDKLIFFRPLMGHARDEHKGIVTFHPQILSDFLTVEELGWAVLAEIDRKAVRVPIGTVVDGEVRPP